MKLEAAQQEFLRDEFYGLTLGATVQRAQVYAPRTPERDRVPFQAGLRQLLKDTVALYEKPIPEAEHVKHIASIADRISARHGRILRGGRFRIGPAQKVLNLFLKYLWCAGWIPTPPHCPFDRRIMSKLPLRDRLNWTDLDDIERYRGLVTAARNLAGPKSIAEWELLEYQTVSTVTRRAT